MKDKYIFEVLLYRENENKFNDKYALDSKKYIEYFSHNMESMDFETRRITLLSIENDYWKRYGAPWNYNQVIGAIKMFVNENEIRGELWLSNKKRYTRNMNQKCISLQGKAFEYYVDDNTTNNEIANEITKLIIESIKYDKRIYIDLECFNNIKKYLDWKSVIRE
jgi:hypothetical protein